MKIPKVKAIVAKGMAAVVLTGSLMVGAAGQAHAQAFAIGVQIGGPHYGYVDPGFYPRQRWQREEFARQQEFGRQQAFAREQAFARQRAYDRERFEDRRDDRRYDAPRDGYGYFGR